MKMNVIRTIIIAGIWLTISLCCFLKMPDLISKSERRPLQQFPDLSKETLENQTFMIDFEKYTMDQFPLRDNFRSLKSLVNYNVFRQKDNNGIYIVDGYAAALEYPMNENLVINATEKMQNIYEKYIEDNCGSVYVSVIPDKNFFIAKRYGYPSMNYDEIFSVVKENSSFAQYIDITDSDLDIEDYYKTDTHWRQECIVDVANKLSIGMNMMPVEKDKFDTKEIDVDFYGVYYGQAALPMKSEKIYYLTNDILEQCEVYNHETKAVTGIYDMDKMYSDDPYEVFLSGASALLTINNPNASTDKELIVFRDSFGSSIIPLIADQYKKIVLVDTRYITSDLVGEYVEFDGQDILFIYSTLVLNNSTVLK